MKLSEIDITTLLPQRPPFVMVGRLERIDGPLTVTSTHVVDDCLFVDKGLMRAEGIMENIAQTCAARLGYQAMSEGGEVKIGVIGAIRDFNLLRSPRVGETLITEVTVEQEVFGITLASAVVKTGEEVVATSNIKIALRDENA